MRQFTLALKFQTRIRSQEQTVQNMPKRAQNMPKNIFFVDFLADFLKN